ncbi:MAG TPA: hypothetical protein VGE15_07270 [Sphingobacteriaceae bacterium]
MSYNGSLFPVLEILIRLSAFNPKIGDYIFHTYSGDAADAIVITSTGRIIVPVRILSAQENDPELLDDLTLRLLALSIH